MSDKVLVRRQWNDGRTLAVPFDKIERLHMSNIAGGHGGRSPRPMVSGYVWCDLIPDGSDFPHSCEHGPPPHRIKVVVTSVDNPPSVMRAIKDAART